MIMLAGQSLSGKRRECSIGARTTLVRRNIGILADPAGELKSSGEVDYLAIDVAQPNRRRKLSIPLQHAPAASIFRSIMPVGCKPRCL
jgi:hypothetical protein